MAIQEIDFNQYRLTGSTVPIPKLRGTGTTSPPQQKFLKGPVPLWWIQAAGMLPGKALHVAIELWYRSGLCKSKVVHFSYQSVQQFGVKRHAAYRALRSLADAGLVVVHRGPGRCPIVTIFEGDESAKACP